MLSDECMLAAVLRGVAGALALHATIPRRHPHRQLDFHVPIIAFSFPLLSGLFFCLANVETTMVSRKVVLPILWSERAV
jgi:hypothetical protein